MAEWLRGGEHADMPVPLEQTSYAVAYFVLPKYAAAPPKLSSLHARWGEQLGAYFYTLACLQQKTEPTKADAEQYRWHHGALPDGRPYHAMEFPEPAPFNAANLSPAALLRGASSPVLAPYFAVILRDGNDHPSYYVLGQSPFGGRTTLRSVSLDGQYINSNHGPGPEPTLAAFLEWVGR